MCDKEAKAMCGVLIEKPHAILGVNSAYHEPSACLLVDGKIVAAAEEERFNRVRHGKPANLRNPHELPVQAIKYCLIEAGLSPSEISMIGYSFSPEKRLASNLDVDLETTACGAGTREGEEQFYSLLKAIPSRLSELLGTDIRDRFRWIDHHRCHASSAYYASPHDESAILCLDGIGEFSSGWLGHGKGERIRPIQEIDYPNSLGFLWTKVSRFLGFGEYGQWKVMALAGYGDAARYEKSFRQFVSFNEDGGFRVDGNTLQFRVDRFSRFEEIFGSHRRPEEGLQQRHYDVAAALQKITDEAVLCLAKCLAKATGSRNLCYAGGVALNCITNRVLVEQGPFESVFIQPAANDAGTSLGACYYLWHHVQGHPKVNQDFSACLGPRFSQAAVSSYLCGESVPHSVPEDLPATIARLLAKGKIGVLFQERMEFGPRALGNRSILADPRRSDMAFALNSRIKHREFFRPFAASVLEEEVSNWFCVSRPCKALQFMLFAYPIREDKLGLIPAVTHFDGTTRIQTVSGASNARFHAIISAFERITGVPMLLNTSFNDQEPIICTPQNALVTSLNSDLDFLVMGDYLIDLADVRARSGLKKYTRSDSALFDGAFSQLQAKANPRSRWMPEEPAACHVWKEVHELLDLPAEHAFTCR